MPTVTIHDAALWVDQNRVPLFAGEMHFWRLNPARWGPILDRYAQLGLNVVASYVCWHYHELAPGKFDFDGQTEAPRNLRGFLDEVAARKLWLFIRPGPYIYAKWANAGVPDRVVMLPRLSEAYRREARVWMQAVTEVLKPYLATRGGNIVLFQPDNEWDLFSHWFEDQCGLDGHMPGFYQQFVREAYGDVGRLNAAWGTSYRSFDEAQAWSAAVEPLSPHDRTRQKDYWRFQHWATREGVRWHVDEFRRLGIDVPQVANFYPGGDVQNWREVMKVVDTVAIDWYPRHEFAGDANLHREFLDSCRYQRALAPLPFIAEFESGVWHGYHDYVGALLPQHYRLLGFSALLAGIQAWNWFMLVARDHWYYSPVSERGDLQPELAEVFAGLHRVIAACDPPTLTKLTGACAVFDAVHIGNDRTLAENPVLMALYQADADFEVFDPEVGKIAKPLAFYAGASWLPRATQQKLVEYVEAGGTLVLAQQWPQRDENFQLFDALGIKPPDRVLSRLGKKVEVDFGGGSVGTSEGHVWVWDDPPGTPLVGTQVAGKQQVVENADKWMTNYIGKRWNCGYAGPRGRGRIIMLGVPLTADLVRAIHAYCGVPFYAQAQVAGVKTALFARGGEHVLIAVNLNASPTQARVTLSGVKLPTRAVVTDLWTGASEPLTGAGPVLALAARSGGVWRISAG